MARVVDGQPRDPPPPELRELVELARGPEVDLLPAILAHVTDPEVVVGRVEREAPRVAKAEADDPPRTPRGLRSRADQLAEQRVHVLGVLIRIAAGASVAEAEVEVAALVELELAAVVVRIGLVDGEQDPGARAHAAPVRRAVSRDPRVPVHVGVRDVEEMVRRVVRTERHREETLLPAARYEVAHVEERAGDLAVAHDADRADLLDDVEGRRISR